MTEEYEEQSMSTSDKIFWAAVGATILYLFLKFTKPQPATASLSPEIQLQLNQIRNQLEIIEERLNINPNTPHTSTSTSTMKQIMENDEDFTIKKDEKGRMCGANFHRKLFSTEDNQDNNK